MLHDHWTRIFSSSFQHVHILQAWKTYSCRCPCVKVDLYCLQEVNAAQLTHSHCSQLYLSYSAEVSHRPNNDCIAPSATTNDGVCISGQLSCVTFSCLGQLPCTQVHLLLSHVPRLRRLRVCIEAAAPAMDNALAPVIEGVHASATRHSLHAALCSHSVRELKSTCLCMKLETCHHPALVSQV